MAVTLETSTKRFRGLSTYKKPGEFKRPGPPVGSVFTETDTGKRFIWRGEEWTRQEQTIESFLAELIEMNAQILAELAAIRRGQEEFVWGDPAPEE